MRKEKLLKEEEDALFLVCRRSRRYLLPFSTATGAQLSWNSMNSFVQTEKSILAGKWKANNAPLTFLVCFSSHVRGNIFPSTENMDFLGHCCVLGRSQAIPCICAAVAHDQAGKHKQDFFYVKKKSSELERNRAPYIGLEEMNKGIVADVCAQ